MRQALREYRRDWRSPVQTLVFLPIVAALVPAIVHHDGLGVALAVIVFGMSEAVRSLMLRFD